MCVPVRPSSDDAVMDRAQGSHVVADVPLRRGLAGWTFQMSGIPSTCIVLAVVCFVATVNEPDRRDIWIASGMFAAISLAGFSVHTRLRGPELRWGFRWRPRRLDLREVTALREGPVPSYRGYRVPGIIGELWSGQQVLLPTSTHLGNRRRSRWMAAIEDARQRWTGPTALSFRDSASQQVQDDLDGLMNAALPFAQRMLAEQGEFVPYGVARELDGETRMVAVDRGHGRPPTNSDLLVALVHRLRSERDSLRAVALVSDVHLAASDAIRVELEHREGHATAVFLPYTKKRLPRGVEFGDLEARLRTQQVWSA
jgi:hypothetical protein